MPDIPSFDDWVKTQDPNRAALDNPRVRQFLDKIGQSEGADYNTLVGGRKINDLSRHPNVVGLRTSAGPSTAFGKYQITGTTNRSKLAKYANLDYSPENQDLRAVELLRQTKALDALEQGDEATAIKRAGKEWASIPGSPLPGRKSSAFQRPRTASPEIPSFDDWVKSETPQQPVPQKPRSPFDVRIRSGVSGEQPGAQPVQATQAARSLFALPQRGADFAGIERRQRQAQATHPISLTRVEPPIDEAAAQKVRGALAASAPPGYSLLPKAAQDYIGGTVASATPSLMNLGAGIAKWTPQDPLANPQDRQQALDKTRAVADEISRGAQTMDVQANRGALSQGAKDVLSGTIASAPAMGLVAIGVPPSAAFALTSALEEQGRGGDLASTLKTATVNGLIGELWELPTPTKAGLLARLEKGLMVGTGTAALTGDPKNAVTQGLIAGVLGGKGREKVETQPEISVQPIPEAQPAERGMPRARTDEGGGLANVARSEVPAIRPDPAVEQRPESGAPRHVDLQARVKRGPNAGDFRKETKAETETRRAQVSQPTTETSTPPQPATVAPSTPSQPPTTPETGTPKLAKGVEAKAVQAKLTKSFEDLPEYQKVNVADQAQRATDLLKSDPEKAKRIAMGDEMPEGDLLPESVFTAVENKALKDGDVDTLRDLATASSRPAEASTMGQRIRMLAERNPSSAVSAIRDVQLAREARAQKVFGKNGANKIKSEIQVELKRAAPKAKDWSSFLEEIKC